MISRSLSLVFVCLCVLWCVALGEEKLGSIDADDTSSDGPVPPLVEDELFFQTFDQDGDSHTSANEVMKRLS